MRSQLILGLFIILIAPSIVQAATIDPVFAQECSAQSRGVADTFPNACDGTYPAACAGDLLSCDDGSFEEHETQGGDFAGVEISGYETSVTDCSAITQVEICYEWWRSFAQGVSSCEVGVDADGGGSYNTATANCPGTSANPGVTCVDVTTTESWTCDSFFGASGTRAQAYMQASKSQGQGGPGNLLFDALYFRVVYEEVDSTPPQIVLESPQNNTWDFDGSVTLAYTPSDESLIDSCELYIDDSLEDTDTSITRDVQNEFVTSLADGVYDWRVECIDEESNTGVSSTRTIRVDTTGPVVNLEAPANDTLSTQSTNTYEYNVQDAQTSIASCSLLVDGVERQTTNDPSEGVTLDFIQTLSNGVREWAVRCTDDNDFTTTSETRTITIDSLDPVLSSIQGTYALGEDASLEGDSFSDSVNITIEYSLPNTSTIINTVLSDGDGSFTDSLQLGYGYPIGTYDALAYRTSDASENASTSFTAALPQTTITTSPDPVDQGDTITITGGEYPENEQVSIILTFNDTSTDTTSAVTNATGGFLTTYNLSLSAPLGLATITGTTDAYTTINATNEFTIEERVPQLETTLSTYGRDETVNIIGSSFVNFAITTLTLFDNTTEAIGESFPLNKTTDQEGNFSHGWDTGDTCNGVYRLEAEDTLEPSIYDETYFVIEEFIENEDTELLVSGLRSTDGTAVDVSLVNESDDNDETQSQGGGTGGTIYWEFNFTTAYNPSLEIVEVLWTIEHSETAGFSNPQLLVWDGIEYTSTSCGSLSTSTTDVTQSCDITSAFEDVSELNEVSLRFQLTKSGGGGQDSNIDYTALNITTQYEPSCTYLNGSSGGGLSANPPSIESITLEDDVLSPADELDLTAGAAKRIDCDLEIYDGNGYTDIGSVNATMHHDSVSDSSPDDPRNHYTNGSCSFVAGAGTYANYTCGFFVEYYASAGNWTCTASADDGIDVDSESDVALMNELFALNISTTTIDYGDLELGARSLDSVVNVSNIGNTMINVTSYGYGATPGDGLAMTCEQGTIPISAQRYALEGGVSYDDKDLLSSVQSPLGLFISSQQTSGAPPQNATFWQLESPPQEGSFGLCNGTVVFEASA